MSALEMRTSPNARDVMGPGTRCQFPPAPFRGHEDDGSLGAVSRVGPAGAHTLLR